MDQVQMLAIVAGAVGERVLLHHPFYRRWEAGDLSPVELSRYAEQYRHVEAALPQVLETILEGLPDGDPRSFVERNLAEERGVPAAHVAMFEEFASRVGARPTIPADPATARLVRLQHDSAARSPVTGIATLAAYECQAGDIALSKAEGLRRHYGIDGLGTWFWDVHAALEAQHADWSLEALAILDAPEAPVAAAASEAAQAWWAFLDERESAAAA